MSAPYEREWLPKYKYIPKRDPDASEEPSEMEETGETR